MSKFKIPSYSVLLIFAALSLIGVVVLPHLSIHYLPSEKQDEITVSCTWPGASARSVEKDVISHLEKMLATVEDVASISSVSYMGGGYVTLSLKKSADVDNMRLMVSSLVRSLYDYLPYGVSYPEISLNVGGEKNEVVLVYNLLADLPPMEIREMALSEIYPALMDIDGIADVSLSLPSSKVYEVVYNPDMLEVYRLSPSDIEAAVSLYCRDYVSVSDSLVISYAASSLEYVPVADVDGKCVFLKDVARIEDVINDGKGMYRVNGLRSVSMSIYSTSSANIMSLCGRVEKVMKECVGTLPAGFSVLKVSDLSQSISGEVLLLVKRSLLCMAILLVFLFITTLSSRYTILAAISLVVNIVTAFVFYYIFEVDLNVYSLAGISISLSIIIDNTIIMISHYTFHRNKSAAGAILAAVLTTVASLMSVWLLSDQIKKVLSDFSDVIVINLVVSVAVSYFFVPALLDFYPVGRRNIETSLVKRRWRISAGLWYERLLFRLYRFRWGVFVFFAILFAGSLYLFAGHLDKGYNYTPSPVSRSLTIAAKMPAGCSYGQLNEVLCSMENFLTSFDQIEKFVTVVRSEREGSIKVDFRKDSDDLSFPRTLKSYVIAAATKFGGAVWTISGVDNTLFSNEFGVARLTERLSFKGYDYDRLFRIVSDFESLLQENPRVNKTLISSPMFEEIESEMVFSFDPRMSALYNVTPVSLFDMVERSTAVKDISLFHKEGENIVVRLVSDKSEEMDSWMLGNKVINSRSSSVRFSSLASVSKEMTGHYIVKKNQEYQLILNYDFIGSNKIMKATVGKLLNDFTPSLPAGFSIEKPQFGFIYGSLADQWYIVVIIVALIFLICAVLFESLLRPLAIICIVPLSFSGLFLSFVAAGVTFDHGGYASMVMLAGIVVNAGLYMLYEYDSLPTGKKRYLRAFNNKIFPIMITVVSTVVGLLPFLMDSSDGNFWYSFALGTIGGMVFSLLPLLFCFPLFFIRVKNGIS